MRRALCHVLLVLSVLAVGAGCRPPAAAVAAEALAPTIITTTTTTEPGPSCCTAEQARYIDQAEADRDAAESHARTVAAVRARFAQHPLRPIAGCESSYEHRPSGEPVWDRYNQQGSTASGGLQVLDSTWRGRNDTGGWRELVPEARQFSRAAHAPDWVQMEVGMRAYDREGSTPWRASSDCWG